MFGGMSSRISTPAAHLSPETKRLTADDQGIALQLCHLRKRIRPGWSIRNVHGQAYEQKFDAGMMPVLLDDVTAESFRYYRGRVAAQAVILRELIDNDRALIERLIFCLWGQDADGGPLCAHRIIHLHISHLRKRLRPGWRIVNRHGQAYELVYQSPVELELRRAA